MELHQVDCFKTNMWFWKYLAIWPEYNSSRLYKFYSVAFISIMVIFYDFLFTINFYFLPNKLDLIIDDSICYFTELSVLSKVLTFFFMRTKIDELLEVLESEMLQPGDAEGLAIIAKAKKFIKTYSKTIAVISFISHIAHVVTPFLMHIIFQVELKLPICNYSFLSDELKQKLIYVMYFYQSAGIHYHMLYNLNIDPFLLGVMILTIAQLEILDIKLRKVADESKDKEKKEYNLSWEQTDRDHEAIVNLNKCILHFNEVCKFCKLIEEIFSPTLFVQFSMASCIMCVCLFRFTLPAPMTYYIFLATYMSAMMMQIMIPCWFGTRLMEKSNHLAFSIYNCDWTPRSRQFKSSLRLFATRANKPLSITGGKMFCLSLTTFTSIMNTAYSYFTLLQHMKSLE